MASFERARPSILRPKQNGCPFADDIFNCILVSENVWISLEISLKFVLMVRINNILTLVQIMAWGRPGDKPLSGTMMVSLQVAVDTYNISRPQWVMKDYISAWNNYRKYESVRVPLFLDLFTWIVRYTRSRKLHRYLIWCLWSRENGSVKKFFF